MKCWFLALCVFISGHVFALPTEDPGSGQNPPEVSENFVIGFEDVLGINVWREPELSVKEVVVRPDGKISLPLIGDIQASGLTTKQLQQQIAEELKEYIAAPTVSVVVNRIASLTVSIQGQVAKTGVYYLGSPMTVLELIARAGGLIEYADKKNVVVIRKEGDQTKHIKFNYKDVSKGKNLQQNITLENGDIVIVPEN